MMLLHVSYFWIIVLNSCRFCVCLVKVIVVSLHWNVIYLSDPWGGRRGGWTVESIFSAAHQVLWSPVAVFPIELHRLSCQSVCNSVHPSLIHLVIPPDQTDKTRISLPKQQDRSEEDRIMDTEQLTVGMNPWLSQSIHIFIFSHMHNFMSWAFTTVTSERAQKKTKHTALWQFDLLSVYGCFTL